MYNTLLYMKRDKINVKSSKNFPGNSIINKYADSSENESLSDNEQEKIEREFQKEIEETKNQGMIGRCNLQFLQKRIKIKKINLPSPRETYEINGAGANRNGSDNGDDVHNQLYMSLHENLVSISAMF